jgi:L-amino acid N-acyltransferase YncA
VNTDAGGRIALKGNVFRTLATFCWTCAAGDARAVGWVMAEDVAVRSADVVADAAAVAAIYSHYIEHSTATFEESRVDATEMAQRMGDVLSRDLPWLVAVDGESASGAIVGYAYASPWRARSAYRFSYETTVYVDARQVGRGIGRRLYAALLPMLRARGAHAVISGIALPNAASVALHESFGMRQVAHFRETGFKFGGWIDVGYWQVVWSAAHAP